jgi:hypothetical protein
MQLGARPGGLLSLVCSQEAAGAAKANPNPHRSSNCESAMEKAPPQQVASRSRGRRRADHAYQKKKGFLEGKSERNLRMHLPVGEPVTMESWTAMTTFLR